MTSDYVIGVDQGTSSTKALLLDAGGQVVAEVARPIAVTHPQDGWVEQDPLAMVDNVTLACASLLDRSGVEAGRVAGLGLDNHTETLVLWDRASGEPVHPAIVWQCRRSTDETDALDDEPTRRLLRARTGLDLDPTFTATKLAWIFRKRPEIGAAIRAGTVLIGTVDCWLIWSLTGGASYASEASNASRTMLYRIDQLAWDSELLALFDVQVPELPDVRRSTGPFGTTWRGLFDAEIAITGALGDQQASLFGHGCMERGNFKSTYGTGAFVWMNAGHDYTPSDDAGYLQTIAWSLERPTYALEGFVMYAGAVLDWLVDTLGLGRDVAEIVRKAEAARGSQGVILVPAFQGLASPWWAPRVRAALMGMSSATDAGHICQAALESICFQVRRVIESMEGSAVRPSGEVRADGGLTRGDHLMQMQADIVGAPVRRAAIENLTPYGAGLMAGLGAGLWETPGALLSREDAATIFRPRDDRVDAWSRPYRDWCAAIDLALAFAEREP